MWDAGPRSLAGAWNAWRTRQPFADHRVAENPRVGGCIQANTGGTTTPHPPQGAGMQRRVGAVMPRPPRLWRREQPRQPIVRGGYRSDDEASVPARDNSGRRGHGRMAEAAIAEVRPRVRGSQAHAVAYPREQQRCDHGKHGHSTKRWSEPRHGTGGVASHKSGSPRLSTGHRKGCEHHARRLRGI